VITAAPLQRPRSTRTRQITTSCIRWLDRAKDDRAEAEQWTPTYRSIKYQFIPRSHVQNTANAKRLADLTKWMARPYQNYCCIATKWEKQQLSAIFPGWELWNVRHPSHTKSEL